MSETYRWFDGDDVTKFIKSFIIKSCELGITPEIIAKYLALSLEGIFEAEKDRTIKEEDK